ncbi:MAG: hypothetical protein ACLFPQ_01870 [Candidatus Woesearchaeota archaeon]
MINTRFLNIYKSNPRKARRELRREQQKREDLARSLKGRNEAIESYKAYGIEKSSEINNTYIKQKELLDMICNDAFQSHNNLRTNPMADDLSRCIADDLDNSIYQARQLLSDTIENIRERRRDRLSHEISDNISDLNERYANDSMALMNKYALNKLSVDY